mgnify:FL=1
MKRRVAILVLAVAVLLSAAAVAQVVQMTTVLTRTAIQATGSGTVNVGKAGLTKARIGVRVTASALWAGTVTLTPHVGPSDTIGGVPEVIVVGDLTASGSDGVFDYTADGLYTVSVDVTGNDKVLGIYAIAYDSAR